MSAALRTPDLPPEALALIKEGTPKPIAEKSVVATPVARSEEVSRPVGVEAASNEVVVTPKLARSRCLPQRGTEPVPTGGQSHLSVRLPSEIPQALLRASLDRKLNRQKPWTQQDITTEALSMWLKRNGYLS